jgi:hypothetical protein
MRHPALGYDQDVMLFGAATHDIGKAAFPAEINGPGSARQEAGRRLLLSRGVSAYLSASPLPMRPGTVLALKWRT